MMKRSTESEEKVVRHKQLKVETEVKQNKCDLFKQTFKKYRIKNTELNVDEVIDFDKNVNYNAEKWLEYDQSFEELANELGMISPGKWKIFSSLKPGILFIKNPFTAKGQQYWSKCCLQDYPKNPNKTNLHRHYDISDDDDIWTLRNSSDESKNILMKKLRWVTFGYHHNWDTKVYSLDEFSKFPEKLGLLCKLIASRCNHNDYKAEAAIVNYYHMDSRIGGHTDHSEFDQKAPLISISFGQSAIFLIGGKTKDIQPHAMFLHSGDIVVMFDDSRLDYHAVPRIIQAPSNPWISEENEEPSDVDKYLQNSRININVRQVFIR